MSPLSCNLSSLAGLSGRFSINDAWDKAPSGYVITIDGGLVVSAHCPNCPDLRFEVEGIAGYMARGFGLLRSVACVAYEPRGLVNEDSLMLGETL